MQISATAYRFTDNCIDNYSIKDLKTKNPEVYFFCLSKDHFHPELKDVIGCPIWACICKPVDPEELFFGWKRCTIITMDLTENRQRKP